MPAPNAKQDDAVTEPIVFSTLAYDYLGRAVAAETGWELGGHPRCITNRNPGHPNTCPNNRSACLRLWGRSRAARDTPARR